MVSVATDSAQSPATRRPRGSRIASQDKLGPLTYYDRDEVGNLTQDGSAEGDLNGTTRFLWGGDSDWQCLEERDGDGDLVAPLHLRPRLSAVRRTVAVEERDLNADDDFGDANELAYYHSNTLFSVYILTDASENAVERYRYRCLCQVIFDARGDSALSLMSLS